MRPARRGSVGTSAVAVAVAVAAALAGGATPADAEPAGGVGEPGPLRPELDLITVSPVRRDSDEPGERQLVRAARAMAAYYRAVTDEQDAWRRGRSDLAARAQLRQRQARAREEAHLREAVALLDEQAPRARARRVRVLTLLGVALERLRRHEEADAVAAELVRVCPGCHEAADAHLQLAGRAFAAGDVERANAHFAAAAHTTVARPEVRAFAHYNLAYCRYDLGDRARAIEHLREAARIARDLGVRGRFITRAVKADLAILERNGSLSRVF